MAVTVNQFGVGLGSQQGLHARLVPLVSGRHQAGAAVDVLRVRVGRVLQEDVQARKMAVLCSSHKSGETVAARQVDARA